jgi:hypothetical protein
VTQDAGRDADCFDKVAHDLDCKLLAYIGIIEETGPLQGIKIAFDRGNTRRLWIVVLN